MKVFFWNVEKSGQTSPYEKQAAHSDALSKTVEKFDVIFFAEMHEARVKDFLNFAEKVYSEFNKGSKKGGASNNYCFLYSNNVTPQNSPTKIGPRPLAVFTHDDSNVTVGIIHCKSGQTDITQKEIEKYTKWLDSNYNGKWVMMGDLNWDYSKRKELDLPDKAKCIKQWDVTQVKGGCLDWFIYGKNVTPKGSTFWKFENELSKEAFSMEYQDHKPIFMEFY